MSGPLAIVDDIERARPLSEKTRSFNAIVYSDKTLSSELDGEVSRASFETPGSRTEEFLLPNGESYSGSLLGNIPEGSGTYVWPDGCKYEGEWRCGMRHGYGKLKWPSGVLYEGEFSGGYMHGTGTYTRPDNMSYRGRWRLNLKHGLGYQIYPNGDVFEGSWIQGTPEGPGKYTWANGNLYLGNMKGGKMSGKGTLTWTNGDSYEGSWLNGMMHGFGVYTWSDCGYYVGTWTRGLKDGKGTFYPKGCKVPAGQQLYLNALRKQGLLPDLRKQNQVSYFHHATSVDMGGIKVGRNRGFRRNSSKLSKGNLLNLEQHRPENVSLVRRWSLEVSIEKVIGHDSQSSISESVLEVKDNEDDINSPILEREYMQGVLINELVLSNRFSPLSRRAEKRQKKLAREIKRPGEQIIKGHRSYDLMLSLQLGIRYTVGKITPIQRREVRATDFGPHASFWMNFPKNGSQLTPPHRSEDFKWKDYCPMVFRNLREMFKIDAADYMMSICGNDALRELSSPGKSGSVFFLSQDDRFMIKTLRKFEVKVLLRMLLDYHHHVQTQENTLITKFFGLHRIKPSSGQKFRFVVMGNMFCTELRIHRRFDLKGSSLGRSANKVEIDESTILKDLDLNYCFYLEPSWRDALLQQIEIDSKFLEAQNIMDYSLLLGVHYRAPQNLRSLMSYSQRMSVDGLGIVAEEESVDDEISPQGLVLVPRGADDNSVVIGPHIRGSRLRASAATGGEEVDLLLPGTARLQIQLGVNMPARAEHVTGKGDRQMFQEEVYDVVLYLGIIDIFQEYNMSKKIEHAYKSIQFDSVSISAVDPTFYSQRFLRFIQKVFPKNAVQD
ncbi:phosphatidylinositol 4-phosphate 5-kinase 9-like [Olea europaea var. sylvestris]|uniref:phosphatidylinositol 4-phosphate 5-kinase 9-like n=1 Tax=Olea europaea var. sylvestris TaxID=158386 RepID=UPI000C1D24A7|nr:phosphatidylinositol 4-phosphate 5-kinase 9-like [Olea europaea var. sylvestris]XP_022878094.1 phosphatidylinositol 4-phosphate 5-kinase 9-like [Olea europaea var. sylvestris]XP_022878095.1 phosphatidylinositol 4-phosphate 5-kinase 9-like [Olea europaea var. sylvestris]